LRFAPICVCQFSFSFLCSKWRFQTGHARTYAPTREGYERILTRDS
jgi:hypothetical protein